MEKKKVILDCDPGHDDAFGIMLAVQHLDVLGITTLGGNCTLENVTRNAIKTSRSSARPTRSASIPDIAARLPCRW